jgi:HPr kinase/phosphorylase
MIKDVAQALKMEVIAGEKGLETQVLNEQLTRPGLELAGMFEFYEMDRIQLLGSREITFFCCLSK